MKTCSSCGQEKEFSKFYQRGDRPGFFRSNCKDCCRITQRTWEQNNPKSVKEIHKFKHIFVKYGITKEEYERLLAEQQGLCATCSTPFVGVVGPKSPCVDHNHENGGVRGLLCRHCNFAIGLANDDPEILRRMAIYLET